MAKETALPKDIADLSFEDALKELESTLPDQALRLRTKEVRIGLEKPAAKAAA